MDEQVDLAGEQAFLEVAHERPGAELRERRDAVAVAPRGEDDELKAVLAISRFQPAFHQFGLRERQPGTSGADSTVH